MQSEDQPIYIGRCLCNCPIYEMDGEVKYTCREYPCKLEDQRKQKTTRKLTYAKNGGWLVFDPNHYRSYNTGYVLQSILIVERTIGKPVFRGIVIHHSDGDRSNNAKNNLVVCESQGYHLLLHTRLRALKACGHPSYRKCKICKKYDDPKNLYISPNRKQSIYHRSCINNYTKERRAKQCVSA